MNTLATKITNVLAIKVRFNKEMMHVLLNDGREISIPLEWIPKLRNATRKQREKWRLIGGGVGIHWQDLDEDLSVAGMLK